MKVKNKHQLQLSILLHTHTADIFQKYNGLHNKVMHLNIAMMSSIIMCCLKGNMPASEYDYISPIVSYR